MNQAERIEIVRNAVAHAATGLKGKDYRAFMELLLSDAEGWRMELEEMEEQEDDVTE